MQPTPRIGKGRNVTGAYLRVKRNGCWENVEVEHLTDAERLHIFSERTTAEVLRWLDLVCNTLAACPSDSGEPKP